MEAVVFLLESNVPVEKNSTGLLHLSLLRYDYALNKFVSLRHLLQNKHKIIKSLCNTKNNTTKVNICCPD